MEQVSLLDEALGRVDANADAVWKEDVLNAIHRLALTVEDFTTDDVWEAVRLNESTTHEPRAIGALMKRAADRGWIRPTPTYRKTTRPEAHGRPIRVWKSRLVGWKGW